MKKQNLLKAYKRPYIKFGVWGIVLTVFSVLLMLILPQITQLFIDTIYTSTGAQEPVFAAFWAWLTTHWAGNTTTIVLFLAVLFVVLALIKGLLSFFASQSFFKFAFNVRSGLRKACFKKLAFAQKAPVAQWVYYTATNSVSNIHNSLYLHRPRILEAGLKILAAAILCLLVDVQIAITFLVFLPCMLLVGLMVQPKVLTNFIRARRRKLAMFAESKELIETVREIKIFGAESWASEKYARLASRHTKAYIKTYQDINKQKIVLNVFRGVGIAVAVFMGALACFNAWVSLGYYVLLVAYAVILFDAGVDFVCAVYDNQVGKVSTHYVSKFLSAPNLTHKHHKLPTKQFDIALENANLNFRGLQTLQDLNFDIPFGTHAAIITTSQRQKDALIDTLLCFKTLDQGTYLLHGKSSENFQPPTVRQSFAFAAQEPAIFEGTIAQNITMFAPVDAKRLRHAIEVCRLEQTVVDLPKKANHFLLENGKNLPAQVLQKIALARAVYRGAEIMLLDNAFNKFLPNEANLLLQNLMEFQKGKTLILLTDNAKNLHKFDKTINVGGEN